MPIDSGATDPNRALRVLVIEDDAGDCAVASEQLRAEYGDSLRFDRAAGYEDGLAKLVAGGHDVCLLGDALGRRTGLELLRAAAAAVRTPVVLLTERQSRAVEAAAADAGAVDCIARAVLSGPLLARTIRFALAQARAREALRRSEARYRSLFDHNSHAVYDIDPGGEITAVNGAIEALIGYPPAELVGTSFRRLIHPDSAERAEQVFASTLAGQPNPYELALQHRDGHRVEIHGISVPIEDRGSVVAVHGTAEDVTHQKQMERELRRHEQEFRALVENAPDLVARFDPDGRFRYVNPAVVRITGRPAAEFIGRRSAEIGLPADLIERWDAPIREVVATGRENTTEFDLPAADGVRRLHARLVPEFAADGSIASVLGIARDITDRVREEERNRFQATLLAAVGEAVMATDLEGRIVYWNSAAEALYGWSAEEALGRPVVEVTPSRQTREQAIEIMARLHRSGSWAGEFVVRRKDGTEFPASVTLSRLDDTAGTMVGTVGVSSDLTERRALETRLRQAEKLEAVGRLAGGIAHDFNNVLTAIQGNAQLLLFDLDDARLRVNVEEIESAARRAADLTRQLLAFSRQQFLQPKVLDLAEAVHAMEGMLRRLIGTHIELSVSAAPDLGNIEADPTQIGQVVMNLAVNARDAMPAGGQLSIRLENAELDQLVDDQHPYAVTTGPYVLLAVTDTGAGMDAETIARLFEPFFTTKGADKGTGLGLPTVYGIVKQSGGYIWVDSVPGQGATFRLYFPRVLAQADTAAAGATAWPPPRQDSGRTVLLCEDEETVRRVARMTLQREEFRVLEAASGQEALEIADAFDGSIDLVLSDVVMPRMSGPELVAAMRRRRPGIKALLMSGYPKRDVSDGETLGSGTPFLDKPFTPEELIARVGEVLGAELPAG